MSISKQDVWEYAYTIVFWVALVIIIGWLFSAVDWSSGPSDIVDQPNEQPQDQWCGPGGMPC